MLEYPIIVMCTRQRSIMDAGSEWAEELSKLLVPSLEGPVEGVQSLEDSSSWSDDRLQMHSEASPGGSEAATQQVQKLLQLGRHEEAIK